MKKAELREKYKELRRTMSPKSLQKSSDQICENVLANFQLEGKMISLFLPIELQKEINTYSLLERAHILGAKVALPKANFDRGEMKHYLYTEKTQLAINPFGIPEPLKGKLVAPDKFDYIFVPLLAIDEKGHRVGYGKGFYDKFLSKCHPNCKFIGLHMFDLEKPVTDILPTDKKLHIVVTPTEVHHFE